MTRERFKSSKPHINLGTIGHVGHGKTTLLSAITMVMKCRYGMGEGIIYGAMDKLQEEIVRGVKVKALYVDYETPDKSYTQLDCPSYADYVKSVISGSAQLDGAILVVSAKDGAVSQARDYLLLLKQIGVSNLVVFLNKEDMIDVSEFIDITKMEIEELLSECGFDEFGIPIVIGSALKALEDPNSEWGDKIIRLMEKVDMNMSPRETDLEKPFLMTVEDVSTITGRGTLVTGRVERGVLKIQDKVQIVGFSEEPKETICTGIEMLKKFVDQTQTKDNPGVLLSKIEKTDIKRGQVLAKPGSIKPHTNFIAEIYVPTKEECGRHTSLSKGYRPQFYFRTADITGSIELQRGAEMCTSGNNTTVTVELTHPIAMEEGLRFDIREDGITVGLGVVVKVLK